MKTWNFGVIGAGLIADFHAKALADMSGARLVGFCDNLRERAENLAKKHSCRVFDDYEEMARSGEIDILTIATPSGLHLEPSLAAAREGKHVLCAKPLEVTLERADAMIEAHQSAGTLLGGILPSRYNESFPILKEAVDSGRFGRITFPGARVPWWRPESYYENSWHGTWKMDGGGALMNQSIHLVDLLLCLMPSVQSVLAFSETLGHSDMETEDTAAAVLRFSDGALGSIYGTTASYPGRLMRLEVTGTRGTAVCEEDRLVHWQFDEERPEDRQIRERFSAEAELGGVSDPAAISHHTHTRSFEAFVAALEEGRGFEIDGAEARKSVELILAVYESAREGKRVDLA